MQDIDFEALDHEVNRIMDEKKELAERKARIRRQMARGRNMDIINKAHVAKKPDHSLAVNTVKTQFQRPQELSSKTLNQQAGVAARPTASNAKNSGAAKFHDIQPKSRKLNDFNALKTPNHAKTTDQKAAATEPMLVVSRAVASQLKTVPAQKSESKATTRGRDLRASRLRERRRSSSLTSSIAPHGSAPQASLTSTGFNPMASFEVKSGNSVVKGHYQTETLSTRQPDGSETVYQHSAVDYVARISADDKAVEQPVKQGVAIPNRVTNLDNRPTVKAAGVLAHPEQKQLSAPVNAASGVTRSIGGANVSAREIAQSPFIESAKVEKRPLGANRNLIGETTTLKLADEPKPTEALLYRGDQLIEDEPKKHNSVLWAIITALIILAAAGGIYLLTIYSK